MDTTRSIQRIRPGTALIRRAAVCLCLAVALTLGAKSSATIVVGAPQYYSSITAACEAASADHSLVLLIFSAEWCGPCKQLKANTLSTQAFAEKAGALKIVDVDVDADNSTASKYGVEAVPTLYLLSGDMKIIAHKSGYQDVTALTQWINEGRERLARGEWEGSAPGLKLTELSRKAASGLNAEDVGVLIQALADSNPTERAIAARLILAQRERAMTPLIGALTNQYLGTRIAASEILHKLAPESPASDPWQSPADLAATASQIARWWDATNKLPQASAVALNLPSKNAAESYLKHLLGNDPIERTEAMSGLVNLGAPVLPAVREALKRAEKQGNHRAILSMEEVRWTILVSDSVEREIGPIRHILAQGTSPERQEAAKKLGAVSAITPLAELASDTDPLVVESALRALSQIGGDEAIPAMKALLASPDSNLRMTAAQGLGHTKNINANAPLITVINDPNEVVACAALAAINEINEAERYSNEEKAQPAEVLAAVKRALSDPRWRVRAAAVETAGKLRASELADAIKPLLNDPDGFVVKNALTTLSLLGSDLESEELFKIAGRLPGLRGEIFALMASHPDEETVTNIIAQFNTSKPGERETILQAILKNSENSSDENGKDLWAPLLIKAATDPEASVRRVAAQALAARPRVFAGKPALVLLNDADPEVRLAAAGAVLAAVSGDQNTAKVIRRSGGLTSMIFGGQKAPKRLVSAEKLAEWHAALAKGPTTNALVAVALAVTGDGTNDLPILASAIRQLDEKQVRQLAEADCLGSLLKKIGWPRGTNLIDSLAGNPLLYTVTASSSGQLPKEMSDYILEPARFVSALEPLPSSQQDLALETLLRNRNDEGKSQWSLGNDSKRAKQIIPLFLQSTNALWRTVAIHLLSRQKEAKKETGPFEKALTDPNAWVKIAALKALLTDRETPEKLQDRVIPLLSNPNTTVAAMASKMMLQPALRNAMGMSDAEVFQFEKTSVYVNYTGSQEDTRTPVLFTNQPAWLPQIRNLAAQAEPNQQWVYVLLLAQYGNFDFLDQVIAASGNDKAQDWNSVAVIYAAISLSNNPKYIPYLRQSAKLSKDDRVLNVIRSMNTPEARQLRREVNLMMRNNNPSSFNNFNSLIEE